MFRQGVKGTDLRDRTLEFITTNVLASADTLFKNPEIELFFLEEMQKVHKRTCSVAEKKKKKKKDFILTRLLHVGYGICDKYGTRDFCKDHHAHECISIRKAGLGRTAQHLHQPYYIRGPIQRMFSSLSLSLADISKKMRSMAFISDILLFFSQAIQSL